MEGARGGALGCVLTSQGLAMFLILWSRQVPLLPRRRAVRIARPYLCDTHCWCPRHSSDAVSPRVSFFVELVEVAIVGTYENKLSRSSGALLVRFWCAGRDLNLQPVD